MPHLQCTGMVLLQTSDDGTSISLARSKVNIRVELGIVHLFLYADNAAIIANSVHWHLGLFDAF